MRFRRAVALALAALAATPYFGAAAELEPRTSQAFEAYRDEARRAFLARIRSESTIPPRDGVLSAGPAREDGIINVPGGLVHHWIAKAFLRETTLRQGLDISSGFSAYSEVYAAVIASRLIARDGDRYRVLMRLEEEEAGVRAVLDVRSTIEYLYPTSRSAFALSNADDIRQVQNAGRPDERLMEAGRDSGYLWRASTFTCFVETKDGLYVETETIGLSRAFPPLLGWIIEPIARRLGRRSMATSLQEFATALRDAALKDAALRRTPR
jgi:hypothetical protein